MTTELVHSVRQGPVCTLTLDSPHNRNALSAQLLDELAGGLDEATTDAGVRVVILTAVGKVFCSGADLSAPPATVASRMPEVLEAIRAGSRFISENASKQGDRAQFRFGRKGARRAAVKRKAAGFPPPL